MNCLKAYHVKVVRHKNFSLKRFFGLGRIELSALSKVVLFRVPQQQPLRAETLGELRGVFCRAVMFFIRLVMLGIGIQAESLAEQPLRIFSIFLAVLVYRFIAHKGKLAAAELCCESKLLCFG